MIHIINPPIEVVVTVPASRFDTLRFAQQYQARLAQRQTWLVVLGHRRISQH